MRRILAVLALCTVATAALALTAADLQPEADDLSADYQSLQVEVDACPGGTCPEASQILADLDALEGRRSGLAADRATLDPCTDCQTLDGVLDSIDGLADVLLGGTGDWDDQD